MFLVVEKQKYNNKTKRMKFECVLILGAKATYACEWLQFVFFYFFCCKTNVFLYWWNVYFQIDVKWPHISIAKSLVFCFAWNGTIFFLVENVINAGFPLLNIAIKKIAFLATYRKEKIKNFKNKYWNCWWFRFWKTIQNKN